MFEDCRAEVVFSGAFWVPLDAEVEGSVWEVDCFDDAVVCDREDAHVSGVADGLAVVAGDGAGGWEEG